MTDDVAARRCLRSTSRRSLLTSGRRVFSVAGSTLWNSLPFCHNAVMYTQLIVYSPSIVLASLNTN